MRTTCSPSTVDAPPDDGAADELTTEGAGCAPHPVSNIKIRVIAIAKAVQRFVCLCIFFLHFCCLAARRRRTAIWLKLTDVCCLSLTASA